MFIDTTDVDEIYESLRVMLEYDNKRTIELLLNDDDNKLMIAEFIAENIIIDEVLINHLARRLIGAEYDTAYNLYSLLLGENLFSSFLNEFGVTFKKSRNGDVDLYFRNKLCNFNDEEFLAKTNNYRLKNRLGFAKTTENRDTCINGFCTAINIQNDNTYGFLLRESPEFLIDLESIFSYFDCCNDYKEMIEKYKKCSEYYCISYKLPINECIIGGGCYAKKNLKEFKIRLLNNIIDSVKDGTNGDYLSNEDDANISKNNIYKIIKLDS